MSTAFIELISSSPFAIIELFELRLFQNLHGDDETYYFHAGRNRKTTEPTNEDDILDAYSIKFGGESYLPLPVEASGFEFSGDGTLPRPTIRFANLQSQMTALLLGVRQITPGNDLCGAQVTRVRTLSRFLDSDNWEDGVNPYGNPDSSANAQFPKEVYYIDRKVAENRDFVEFELTSSFDMAGVKAPRRLVMQNLCQWEYKSKECGYTGSNAFNKEGTQITLVNATGFGYSTNQEKLTAGSSLIEGEALISTNGWFQAKVQKDGNFVIYKKPGGSSDHAIWSSGTVLGENANGYTLIMQKDGNLVLYNDDFARNAYPDSVVWTGVDTHRIGQIASIARLSIDGADQWTPPDINVGRSGGFTWELKQSSPSSAGQTTTADKNFTETHPEWGTRSVNIRFSLESVALAAGNYSQNNSGYTGFGWNKITGYQILGQTGLWKDQEDWTARLTLSSNNPFRANHPTDGTLQEVGAIFKITATGFLNAKQLRLKDDGVLVVEDSDGSDVLWRSTNQPITSEPQVEQITNVPAVDADVCGKRISDCKARFTDVNGVVGDAHGGLPFGSFPAVGLNN